MDGEAFIIYMLEEYVLYLNTEADETADERRTYMFQFLIMCRIFRQLWHAIQRGDRVMMEKLTCDWIGVFFVLKKRNYVKITLSAIEKEYNDISYSELTDLRINASIRYQEGNDMKGNPFPMHFLDKVMENINAWTKKTLTWFRWIELEKSQSKHHVCS